VLVSEKDRFLLKVIRDFVHDENGLEMIEWAIVGALIISIATTAIAGLGSAVAAKFNLIDLIITSLP
jgi:Flp pilus assembly pilin Flp